MGLRIHEGMSNYDRSWIFGWTNSLTGKNDMKHFNIGTEQARKYK